MIVRINSGHHKAARKRRVVNLRDVLIDRLQPHAAESQDRHIVTVNVLHIGASSVPRDFALSRNPLLETYVSHAHVVTSKEQGACRDRAARGRLLD